MVLDSSKKLVADGIIKIFGFVLENENRATYKGRSIWGETGRPVPAMSLPPFWLLNARVCSGCSDY
jgi:hypothetical protein